MQWAFVVIKLQSKFFFLDLRFRDLQFFCNGYKFCMTSSESQSLIWCFENIMQRCIEIVISQDIWDKSIKIKTP